MTLTSLSFYLLVLALLVLYYLVPKRFQWVVLLIGSYAFYAFVCLRYMGFIVVTTLTTYFGARGMDAMTARMEQTVAAHKQDWEREERKAYKKRCKSRRKALMIAILLLNFGILAVLKYYNFFAESMEALFASVGLTVSLGHIGLLLPLGISFYTFQSMGYVLDVYREKVPAERNVGKLALFVSFFPQIIQGPIGVYDQLAHQLYAEHRYSFDNIRYGAELILWGFFKKLVIADRAVGMIHTVAGAYTDYAGTYVLLAAIVGLFAAAYVALRKRIRDRQNAVLMRGKRANKVAVQRFRAAAKFMQEENRHAFYEEMLRALWGYMSDKFNIPVANLTKENVREELNKRGVSQELSQSFSEIISQCDEAQYSPLAGARMSDVYNAGVDFISKLESVIKK